MLVSSFFLEKNEAKKSVLRCDFRDKVDKISKNRKLGYASDSSIFLTKFYLLYLFPKITYAPLT